MNLSAQELPLTTQESPLNWYAVHTRSNFEKRVATDLASVGLESYCPLLERASRRTDRRQIIQVPVFPGYFFVRLDQGPQQRRMVTFTNGVVRILGFSGSPEAVPDAEVDGIRRLLANPGNCIVHPAIREGSRVRVIRGPLRGLEGRLIRVKNRSRLSVSVSLLSQAVCAEIEAEDVEVL